ncbi:hypothetical protein H6F32_15650 [Anabaena sp. FACHB-1237]|uniref:hypothetical protein n=1 Tax=Anabaena sp. FACHB-1237 TaxID=2692769 RepID=UPI001681144F|nr:hypothetical protein [Anabaena sp. FACHB-1237]MBD2138972.1 hypothetical protein [Anabaena sp. FACHB-1237]
MKTPTGSPYQQSPQPNYPPTVPLCVYRELTKELEALQAKLDVVTSQNHKLAQENTLLKQEFHQVVKSCLELQKLLYASQNTTSTSPVIPKVAYKSQVLDDPVTHSPIHPDTKYSIPTPTPINTPSPPPIVSDLRQNPKARTKPPATPLTPPSSKKKVKPPKKRPQMSSIPAMDINSPILESSENVENIFIEEKVRTSTENDSGGLHTGWLMLMIIFIMITGFSAGYLIVRPLLESQTQVK